MSAFRITDEQAARFDADGYLFVPKLLSAEETELLYRIAKNDRAMLEMRVRKLEAGSAWAEDPPSRSRHFVSNVRVLKVEGDEITLDVCFLLRRTRLNSELTEWFGASEPPVSWKAQEKLDSARKSRLWDAS